MNVLAIMPAYNESALIAYKAQWLKEQGFSWFVIDNYSTDGTYEMLDKLPGFAGKIRFSTGGAFHLTNIQHEVERVLKFLRPDWCLYGSVDLFNVLKDCSLHDAIKFFLKNRFNAIEIKGVYNIVRMPTDPDYRTVNPARTFFRYQPIKQNLSLLFRYDPRIQLFGDTVKYPRLARIFPMDGINLNLGFIKSIEERQETFERRKKAWEQGLRRRFGYHYEERAEKNWLFSEEETLDIRESPYNWAWQALAKTFDKVKK